MGAVNDYYVTLGVAPNATRAQIARSYRKESRRWHPDLNPDKNATERMQQINEAYFVLSDPVARSLYDAAYRPIRRQQPANTTPQESGRVFKLDGLDPILEKKVMEAKAKALDPSNWVKDAAVDLGTVIANWVMVLLVFGGISHGASFIGMDSELARILGLLGVIVFIGKYY